MIAAHGGPLCEVCMCCVRPPQRRSGIIDNYLTPYRDVAVVYVISRALNYIPP